jgi:hypothetical protein
MFILLNKVNCMQDIIKYLVKFGLDIWHCRAITILGGERKVSILLQSGIGRKSQLRIFKIQPIQRMQHNLLYEY